MKKQPSYEKRFDAACTYISKSIDRTVKRAMRKYKLTEHQAVEALHCETNWV